MVIKSETIVNSLKMLQSKLNKNPKEASESSACNISVSTKIDDKSDYILAK